MKILIIHPYFKTHYKAVIYSSLSSLIELNKNYELKVLQLFLSESSRQKMETVDYSIHNYPYHILFKNENSQVSFFTRLRAIFKYIKGEKPSVINVTGYYDLAVIIPALWFRLKGVPIVMSIDSTLNENNGNFISSHIKRWILSSMDGFFSYGKKSTELILHFGQEEKKVLLENNAVDNERLAEAFDSYKVSKAYFEKAKYFPKKSFIFVGRLIPEKNLQLLLESFIGLKNKEWGLIIVGTGILESELKAKYASMGNIFFEDPMPWYDVPKILAHSKVFILPSISEPWGLVVNEAMSCGLPVIVSKACGCAEDLVKSNLNGFKFDPSNKTELINHMDWCINNDDKLEKMGLAGQKIIERYSPSIVAKQMFEGFKSLAA